VHNDDVCDSGLFLPLCKCDLQHESVFSRGESSKLRGDFTSRHTASAVGYYSHGPVSVCVTVSLSQVGVLSKVMNRSSSFFALFDPSYTLCVTRKFGYLQN